MAGRLLRLLPRPIPTTPTFLRFEYAGAKSDPYAAYLARALRRYHRGQAVMVTEFGVPSGLGAAHRGPKGRDQGDHSEQEAGRMQADMLACDRAGGLRPARCCYAWTDEWFKRTWNTIGFLYGLARPYVPVEGGRPRARQRRLGCARG